MVAAKKPQPTATPDDLMTRMWSKDLPREHDFEPLRVEGTIPAELAGTLYRNGPGQFGQLGKRYSHPFEADGATTAIRIANGKATGASKLHATEGLVEERAAGKLLYGLSASWPRRFSNNLRGKSKNTANTSIRAWQGRLYALMEAGKPTEIDPETLATIGETDLGVVSGFFSAHPHRVASRNAMYNFGLEYGRHTKLHLYELPDVGTARHLGAITLAGPPMLHDFIATDTHLVFFVSPVRVQVPRMLLAVGGFDQLFRWKPEHGTEVICVPIDRPSEPLRFTADAFYQWHFANAFTRGGQIVVDYVRYPDFATFYQFGAIAGGGEIESSGRFHRATIDLSAKTLRSEQLSDRAAEFPSVRPGDEGREHALAYSVFDHLGAIGSIDAKGTTVVHELPAGERITEPLYVAGHLLALCHTPDRAYVAIYDANASPTDRSRRSGSTTTCRSRFTARSCRPDILAPCESDGWSRSSPRVEAKPRSHLRPTRRPHRRNNRP
jgi:all-trans-8'-apo-beta-carotenal 15,15'-oxygenase